MINHNTVSTLAAASARQFPLALIAIALSSTTVAQAPRQIGTDSIPPGAIVLNPGENVESIVKSSKAPSTFYFNAGTYRMQSITPRSGDIYVAAPGAILNGSALLTGWAKSGNLWYVRNSSPAPRSVTGVCESNSPRCNYPQDLFLNGRMLNQVASESAVISGTWFFDYTHGVIYMADNPTGQTVELGMTEQAFGGGASHVTINGLTIEKYATPTEVGAVATGADWIVENSAINLNHSFGIVLTDGVQLLNSYIEYNGQVGIGSPGGSNIVVQGNEIAFNNSRHYNGTDWEAGGTKFHATTSLLVNDNYAHDNRGPGLDTDYDNQYTTFENNHTANNIGAGILEEISSNATIRNNLVENDGFSLSGGGKSFWYGGGILVNASSNVEIYGNTVTNCMNGIGGLQANRGSHYIQNLSVHDNTVTQTSGTAGGIVSEIGTAVFTSWNNHWTHNTYSLGSNPYGYQWMNSNINKTQWKKYGNDTTGTWK